MIFLMQLKLSSFECQSGKQFADCANLFLRWLQLKIHYFKLTTRVQPLQEFSSFHGCQGI